jgi:hypothetical protein
MAATTSAILHTLVVIARPRNEGVAIQLDGHGAERLAMT